MTVDYQLLARDLIQRTEAAVTQIASAAAETNITFEITDIVDAVERSLPKGYPAPTSGTATRRDVIADMARDILSGEMYEGA